MHVPSFLCQSVPELEIAYMYICLFTSLGSVLVPLHFAIPASHGIHRDPLSAQAWTNSQAQLRERATCYFT